jgi:formylglycine-generating enzyme required for sulfatase activity
MNCPKCHSEMIKGRKGFVCEECGERVSSISPDLPIHTDLTSLVSDATIQDDVTSLQAGRYSIIETLGKGGMGVVYRALDTRLKRNVAIKGMLPELLGQDRSEQRFMREAQSIASIDHQGVIRVHDYFSEHGAYYMVMEYFQAMSLSEYVSHLPNAKEHDFTPIFTQVLDALEAVHQRSQVHRDLKPSNVLINAKEQIRLIDFGLVKGGGSLVSVSGKYLGTPGYTAPEQEIDSAMADARSDIYSMGGLMYYCASGGKHPPRVVFPNAVPEAYREQILTCLNEMQEKRYQNAHELKEALNKVSEETSSNSEVEAKDQQATDGPGTNVKEVLQNEKGALTHEARKPQEQIVVMAPTLVQTAKKETSLKAGTIQEFSGIEFVYCPAGEFMMGSKDDDDESFLYGNEQPVHEVEISRCFWLGKYPVTQGQWAAVMGQNPSRFVESKGFFGLGGKEARPDHPVEQVSWDDTRDFIDRLNEKQRAKHYRLPTEAEWEHACRAGSTTAYCFGDGESKLKEYAWFDDNSGRLTHPVGKKRPNDWGLYDMHGNVWEWVLDWYDENYYKNSPGADPLNTSAASSRVIRGGGWNDRPWSVRSAFRSGYSPGYRDYALGFRLLRIASP